MVWMKLNNIYKKLSNFYSGFGENIYNIKILKKF